MVAYKIDSHCGPHQLVAVAVFACAIQWLIGAIMVQRFAHPVDPEMALDGGIGLGVIKNRGEVIAACLEPRTPILPLRAAPTFLDRLGGEVAAQHRPGQGALFAVTEKDRFRDTQRKFDQLSVGKGIALDEAVALPHRLEPQAMIGGSQLS